MLLSSKQLKCAQLLFFYLTNSVYASTALLLLKTKCIMTSHQFKINLKIVFLGVTGQSLL